MPLLYGGHKEMYIPCFLLLESSLLIISALFLKLIKAPMMLARKEFVLWDSSVLTQGRFPCSGARKRVSPH